MDNTNELYQELLEAYAEERADIIARNWMNNWILSEADREFVELHNTFLRITNLQ